MNIFNLLIQQEEKKKQFQQFQIALHLPLEIVEENNDEKEEEKEVKDQDFTINYEVY